MKFSSCEIFHIINIKQKQQWSLPSTRSVTYRSSREAGCCRPSTLGFRRAPGDQLRGVRHPVAARPGPVTPPFNVLDGRVYATMPLLDLAASNDRARGGRGSRWRGSDTATPASWSYSPARLSTSRPPRREPDRGRPRPGSGLRGAARARAASQGIGSRPGDRGAAGPGPARGAAAALDLLRERVRETEAGARAGDRRAPRAEVRAGREAPYREAAPPTAESAIAEALASRADLLQAEAALASAEATRKADRYDATPRSSSGATTVGSA